MVKSHSQLVNLASAPPLMNPLIEGVQRCPYTYVTVCHTHHIFFELNRIPELSKTISLFLARTLQA